MKKYKQFEPINNQEDEDSSSYPLYPPIEDIHKKEKKKKGPHRGINAEITGLTSKITKGTINNMMRIQ